MRIWNVKLALQSHRFHKLITGGNYWLDVRTCKVQFEQVSLDVCRGHLLKTTLVRVHPIRKDWITIHIEL